MSFPNILDFIGNSEIEIHPNNKKSDDTKVPIKPLDAQRQTYADALFVFAIQFLIIHELAHILNGHIDLKKTENNTPFIFEVSNFNKNKSGLNSQTLECDADFYASNISLKLILAGYQNQEKLSEAYKPYFSSLEDTLFLWSFAAYSIFRFLGNKKIDFQKLDNYSHPFLGFRQYWIFSMMYDFIGDTEYSFILDKFTKEFNPIFEFEKTVKIYNDCLVKLDFINPIEGFPIELTFTNEGWNQLYKIQNNWGNMRPLLEPYSTAPLAPILDLNEEEFRDLPIIRKIV